MIRIMIVDDEPHIIRRLRRYIEQNEPGFEIVATACDGRQALDLLEHTDVDILFTDIRMPIMDGIALLKRVDERWPHIAKVVISGYDEFEYAADALRANARDYLLKPVAEDQLHELFGVLGEQARARNHDQIWRLLRSLVDGVGPKPADTRALDTHFRAAVLCAGNIPLYSSCELSPDADFWQDSRLERALKASCGAETPEYWVLSGTMPVERVLLVPETVTLPEEELFACLCAKGGTLNAIFDDAAVSVRALPERLALLNRKLREQVRLGRSALLRLDALPPAGLSTAKAIDLARVVMRTGDARSTDELFLMFEGEDWTQMQIADALTLALAQNHHGDKHSMEEYLCTRGAMLDAISDAADLQELKNSLLGLFDIAPVQIQEDVQRMKPVADYLDAHYADSITTQTLAATFGYVPGYLSLLFRREYGCSPSEYLQNVRIEHAKEILTREHNTFVKDVAFRVGFKNQFHFSKTFKAVVGIQPSDYR
ncbi:MAG: response regulator [Aristaeellaceae bacterium]